MWLDRLNEMKKQRGVTLKDISEGAGISIGTVNKLFSGQTDDPKIGTLRPIVHFMGYTLDDLEDKETPPAESEGVTPEEVAEALVAAMCLAYLYCKYCLPSLFLFHCQRKAI